MTHIIVTMQRIMFKKKKFLPEFKIDTIPN